MSTSLPAQDARPPDLFVSGAPRDSTLGNQLHSGLNEPGDRPRSLHGSGRDSKNNDHTSDTDTEMADALSYFEGDPDSTAVLDQEILKRLPGFFRLVGLIDEHGLGGTVEKTIIDQRSLHQLLNTLQPGSCDSVSKINFKSLDNVRTRSPLFLHSPNDIAALTNAQQLSIKPTGVYGIQSEIISFLQQVRCLSDDSSVIQFLARLSVLTPATGSNSAMLLLHSRTLAGSTLCSGLCLVLHPDDGSNSPSKRAYIVYWPEDSTWDDQAASSSAQHNRVIFMRYLTKITDQLIALVSPAQANAFVWETSTQGKDQLTSQWVDDEDDEDQGLRVRSFEVSKPLEQNEDATASTGFTVPIEPKYLPKDANNSGVSLVHGDQKPALLVWTHEPQHTSQRPFDEQINSIKLRNAILSKKEPIQLGNLSLDSLLVLEANGLRGEHSEPFEIYNGMIREAEVNRSRAEAKDIELINERIEEDTKKVKQEVHEIIRVLHSEIYPSLKLTSSIAYSAGDSAALHERYSGLRNLAEDVRQVYNPDVVTDKRFQDLKHKWFLLRDYLTTGATPPLADPIDFVNEVLDGGSVDLIPEPEVKHQQSASSSWTYLAVNSLASWAGGRSPEANSELGNDFRHIADPDFVQRLRPLEASFPSLSKITEQVYECLAHHLTKLEGRVVQNRVDQLVSAEKRSQNDRAKITREAEYQSSIQQAFETLLHDLQNARNAATQDAILVNSVRPVNTKYGYTQSNNTTQFYWSGTRIVWHQAQTRYRICPLELTEGDSQICRADEAYVPQPKLKWGHKFEFTLETHRKVEFLCLVRNKCLVVVSEPEQSRVYIEDKISIDRAINTSPAKITLHHKPLGGSHCIFAFDQTTRLFAIIHGQEETLRLSVYVFDELFVTLLSRGSPIQLKGWYDSNTCISKACFVTGSEQICLFETSGQARIFSLVTRQFRSPSLKIDGSIVGAFSAPDGSCSLVVAADRGSPSNLHKPLAFRWTSFGSNQNGIHLAPLVHFDAGSVATRFEGRGRVHILTLASNHKIITSTSLQIKQKATKYSLRFKHGKSQVSCIEPTNNSLIDCHYEVWTRFPVAPAVSRTALSPVVRRCRKLTFATFIPQDTLHDYFTQMIAIFEKTTRKPVGGALSAIAVESATSVGDMVSGSTSEFRLGSFIMELFCLVPLHLAISRDNRFILLKDGVWEPEYERSLLGANVHAVIDALSLGWYESLFQSYMVTKPVRVVSSMGEQSVGKSYCLNHFADTSFAGSAMRTTEGVWLSCTPTDNYLLVSLDFEGVQSIERSVQEDALLVLFNTAISNLVLFRNNLTMSRDIAGLFMRLQSSAMILNPDANRGLFNSVLAIIIKDVTKSDANDITNEVSLKFQEMIEKEKEQNFITRLYRGRLDVIPWPVINSPGFYTMFRWLQQKLDRQEFTHGTARVFLHSFKTLMAKINTSDWSTLDQTLAAHRAEQLRERLPDVLCHGRTSEGRLKNMDTDEEFSLNEQHIVFFLSDSNEVNGPENEASVEQHLQAIIEYHEPTPSTRYRMADAAYVEILQQRIHDSLDQRVALVRQWIGVNIGRFQAENQDIRKMVGKLEEAALAMRAAVRICSITCSKCQLLCLRPHRHTGDHDCGTNHRCVSNCSIMEKHSGNKPCGLPAGHSEQHMCSVKVHFCAEVCHLSNMGGCAQSCVQPLYHGGNHLCSAGSHFRAISVTPPKETEDPTTVLELAVLPGMSRTNAMLVITREPVLSNALCAYACAVTWIIFMGYIPTQLICVVKGIVVQDSARPREFARLRFSHLLSKDNYSDVRLASNTQKHDQLHDTSHGSMAATSWAMKGENEDLVYEIQGRKFGPGGYGAPMLCSLVCAAQGRHAHVGYCNRDHNNNPESEHIAGRIYPNPDQAKDWISHSTSWARSGFKDPYSHAEQDEFSKCDVLCPGPEHEATATEMAESSYCILPIFHPPQDQQIAPTHGYVSLDGHVFACQNPARPHQLYHIVFVINSSSSMVSIDHRPLANTPISRHLEASCNNRYGTVLSALHSFWLSREPATHSPATQARQDAYSVVMFDQYARTCITNDLRSTTRELINLLIPQTRWAGADFQAALTEARRLIEAHWSTDRAPVVIFLSDGECKKPHDPVYDLCQTCVRQGKPLAFHSVSFGSDRDSASLRQMVDIAHEAYTSVPQDVLADNRRNPCTYTNAIDSVELTDAFLGVAGSLQKPEPSPTNQMGGRRATHQ
ncbi:hypothetical protein BDV93DRAFT_552935 [Ceratobasidium sp. AG-I]|nr:hypothetical protein BDV93DRAFT_552935 [Ceratobasidium sp. AG-I]